MEYKRENEYNAIYQQASSEVALPVELLKAISAVESEFQNMVVCGYPPRYGLMGLTLPIANALSNGKEISRSDLLDANVNIRLGAKFLRLLYFRLNNPDMFDVIGEYGRQLHDLDVIDHRYVDRVWEKYRYFTSKSQPESCLPKDVSGVSML